MCISQPERRRFEPVHPLSSTQRERKPAPTRRVAPGRDEQTDVGRPVADGDRVLIVEDVTTAGTSIRETVPVLRAAADVRLAGFVVSVDRMERSSDATDRTALA
ncbi:MAG: hypothetical protein GY911_10225 [Actinomycetales bacterium]|nr:hypothetical protein [Actinomycetales bacterium]